MRMPLYSSLLRVWIQEESVRKQTTLMRTRSESEGPRWVLACSNKFSPANLSWSPSIHCPITSGLKDQVTVVNKALASVGTETRSSSTTFAIPSRGLLSSSQFLPLKMASQNKMSPEGTDHQSLWLQAGRSLHTGGFPSIPKTWYSQRAPDNTPQVFLLYLSPAPF